MRMPTLAPVLQVSKVKHRLVVWIVQARPPSWWKGSQACDLNSPVVDPAHRVPAHCQLRNSVCISFAILLSLLNITWMAHFQKDFLTVVWRVWKASVQTHPSFISGLHILDHLVYQLTELFDLESLDLNQNIRRLCKTCHLQINIIWKWCFA